MTTPRNQLLVGDALAQLRRLPAAFVDQVLTSPPYFRLRDYGVGGQIGLEPNVTAWVEQLRGVAAELRRVLVPTGSLWLNLGDSYAIHPREGAPRKSLVLAPERLAQALVADGWRLRNKIVWQKANPMPSSVTDRLACTWEVVYVFAHQPRYFFDLDVARQPHTSRPARPHRTSTGLTNATRRDTWLGPNADGSSGLRRLKAAGLVGHPLGKNPGDVWRLPTSSYRGAHHAIFPETLAQRIIRLGCPLRRCTVCQAPYQPSVIDSSRQTAAWQPGCGCAAASEPGLVLDPFFGAATTGLAAEGLGRDWLGIELSPDFAAAGLQRLAEARASPRAA